MVNLPETATNTAIVVPQAPNEALPEIVLLQEAVVEIDREVPEIPPAVNLTIKQRSFRKINPAYITDQDLLQTDLLRLELGRQYLEELSCIPSFLKLDVEMMWIEMAVVLQVDSEIQSLPAEIANFLRQFKDNMATAKIAAGDIRLRFSFYGGIPFEVQDRTAVMGHDDLREFNIIETKKAGVFNFESEFFFSCQFIF